MKNAHIAALMARRRGPASCIIGPVWTARTIPTAAEIQAVAVNPAILTGGFVVSGVNGGSGWQLYYTSDGGVTWTQSATSFAATAGATPAAHGLANQNGSYICIGGFSFDFRSTDEGVTWTQMGAVFFSHEFLFAGGGKFLALEAGTANLWTTAGGIAPFVSQAIPNDSWACGNYAGNRYIIAAASGNTIRSTTGAAGSWTAGGVMPAAPRSIAGNGSGVWVATINAVAQRVMVSIDDGVTWALTPIIIGTVHLWTSVLFSQGLFSIIEANGNPNFKSSDGVNYSASGAVPGVFAWLAEGDGHGHYVAAGDSGVNSFALASGVC